MKRTILSFSILSFPILSCAIMVTVAFAFIAGSACAAPITMQIRGPGSQLSTIAVSGLKSLSGDDDHHISSEFITTLRKDLELSGYFRIIDPHAYGEDPQSSAFELGQLNFEDWRSISADFLIKGSVAADASGIKLTAYL